MKFTASFELPTKASGAFEWYCEMSQNSHDEAVRSCVLRALIVLGYYD